MLQLLQQFFLLDKTSMSWYRLMPAGFLAEKLTTDFIAHLPLRKVMVLY